MIFCRAAIACGAALLAGSVAAQVPPDIVAQVRAGGQTLDPIASGALYAPLFADETYADLTVTRDIAYGEDPLQKLDVYEPAKAAAERLPVVVFIHGGGFTRGDKHGPYYPDNLTAWAARNGMIAVNVNYRLAPATVFPGAVQDFAAALRWVRANIAAHGGDPDRIVLSGHSAGANHVIDYLGHKELQGEEAKAIRGAILLSPNYASEMPAQPNVYYGADADAQLVGTAAARLHASGVPVFLGYAQFDPEPMRSTAKNLIAVLCRSPETCPAVVELPDHNHYTEGDAVGTDDTSLTAPLLEWLRSVR